LRLQIHKTALKATLKPFVGKVDVSTNTGLKLGFAITNINKKPVKFLKWATPFEGAFSNMFIVRNADGIRQRYVGADARRKPLHDVNEEDFIELKPGQSERIMVDITDQYEFDGDGAYYIRVGNPEDGHIRYTDMMETRVRVEITGTEKQKAFDGKWRHNYCRKRRSGYLSFKPRLG